MYAKIINNVLVPAPKIINYDGNTIVNPSEKLLLRIGYLPVTYTDMPTDAPEGQHYESHWEQTDTEIVQVWTLVDNPAEPDPELSADEALNIIMGVAE